MKMLETSGPRIELRGTPEGGINELQNSTYCERLFKYYVQNVNLVKCFTKVDLYN